MVRDIISGAVPKMDKAVDHLKNDLLSLRTGRASVAMVDGVLVEQYGQKMPLRSLATISTPDARTIAITPWDRSSIPAVEKAIRENQALGFNPMNDGNTVRLNIPPLTEERRKQIVKQLGEKVESCHIAIRNIRHEVLQDVKKLEKDKQATQDDVKFAENELNKKIDTYKSRIEEISKAKEKEIMEV